MTHRHSQFRQQGTVGAITAGTAYRELMNNTHESIRYDSAPLPMFMIIAGYVYVCVCVRERERERDEGSERERRVLSFILTEKLLPRTSSYLLDSSTSFDKAGVQTTHIVAW